MRYLLLSVLLMLFSGRPLAAAPAMQPDHVRVKMVTDGDTLVLEDGAIVRLVGIQAPKLPLGRKQFKAWPLAEEAREALVALTQDRTVQPGFGGARADRHGRVLAHLYRQPDGLWLQGEMLRLGLARVYTFSDNIALSADMLALEREARAAKRGIWADEFYAVRSPDVLAGLQDSFQLVQGKVHTFAKISDYMFLNFGADYKTDFTVVIDRKDWPRFTAGLVDLQSSPGKILRVRGWLENWNGPMIRVTHPEQIEVVE